MQTDRGLAASAFACLAVLAGAVLLSVGLAPSPSSAAVPLDFTLTFPDLAPGETRTEAAVVVLDRDALLDAVTWEERTGLLESSSLALDICRSTTCVSADDFRSTRLTAGPIDVRVTVTVPTDAPPAATGSALGRLSFIADDDDLATTGSDAARLITWGLSLTAAGLALALGLGISRRVHRDGKVHS
ncbi:hypothetical protein [Plantibacter sp. ME-Dv--P-122b]|uniref:hypothetical protein n=1 Tax=Plantibacter sp. ME-Dv--P-122b TaxID=3040300 RepID=UPI00254D00AE|nr:hypothetical protein [Plantibacter sp. ME-Dv--P-122b]